MEASREVVTWERFKEELWSRFEPAGKGASEENLMNLRQAGPVDEHKLEFEKLTYHCRGWHVSTLINAYLAGLKSAIAGGVRQFQPEWLREAFRLVKGREEELEDMRLGLEAPVGNVATPARAPPYVPFGVIKRTPAEIARRRRDGMCFNYDERFTIDHHCPGHELFLMVGDFPDDVRE
ncbi:unnamed protein product [Linum trigynum]|uniref:Retrotransposon gag domain-containing protein n=1 Tax=Linum trigynum TaxID=586398 RepID=A0AAV2F9Q4_9ROSI